MIDDCKSILDTYRDILKKLQVDLIMMQTKYIIEREKLIHEIDDINLKISDLKKQAEATS